MISKSATAQIAAAEYYVDTDNGEGSNTAISSPVDGTFDESSEEITINLDASGLTVGQHVVYVRFQDNSGTWGTPKEQYFV